MTGDDPVAECFNCGAPATEAFGGSALCAECDDALDSGAGTESDESGGEEPDSGGATPTPRPGKTGSGDEATPPTAESWRDVSFADTEADLWPPAHRDTDAWMLRKGGKAPWAPWADADAPVECSKPHPDLGGGETPTCAGCDHSARYKWGSDGSAEHVHTNYATALDWREKHPQASSDLVFIQSDDDPFGFVDGDDVRDPETGDVHPEFVRILDALGVSYADVSTSGAGVHVMYRGELPEGVPQAVFKIDDEAFGANDEGDLPTVEIYDGKHVCVATGDHVVSTGTEVREWDDDALADVLDEYDQLPSDDPSAAYDAFDAEEYDADATTAGETADDIRDLFAALDRLDARRVADRTIVREWLDPSGTKHRAFAPTWAPSDYDGTANFVNRQVWKDKGTRGGYGGPVVMAAIDAGLVRDKNCPEAVRGETWFEAVDHLRELGFDVPELADDAKSAPYDDDPREAEAVVDPERAWAAAGSVTPDEVAGLDAASAEAFACPCCGEGVDVVRAVAVAEEFVETCDAPLTDAYPAAYAAARDAYDAPLPRYLTTADAVAEFDAVLSLIRELGYWHLDTDALRSDVTAEGGDVGGEAVRALDPAWRESESGESVLVFESGTVWDADTERTIDALRFVALDAGLLGAPGDDLEGEAFTEAYRLAREEYGAPLPRWEPAADADRSVEPMLPPSDELVDEPETVAVDPDPLDEARGEVENLVREAASDAETPTVVTALPATGKTTATVKLAAGDEDRDGQPVSYLAPRKELQQQALDKAEKWGADAMLLPVFADETVDEEVLHRAVAHVREHGKDRLRDLWGLHSEVVGEGDAVFVEADEGEDAADLDRATCDTADGEHGDAWALAVHAARKSWGFTPREIHAKARGLFGAELPCSGECPYSEAWDAVSNPDDAPDLLVGSYVHAHVESVRTHYQRGNGADKIIRAPRAVVLDEYPGQAFETEFGEEALDHATWLARALRDDVDDRRDMFAGELWGDEFVRAWLRGDADETVDAVGDAVRGLDARAAILRACDAAVEIREEVDSDLLDDLDLAAPLADLCSGVAPDVALGDLAAAVGAANPEHGAYGIVRWVEDAVVDELRDAPLTHRAVDTDALPGGGELHGLVERAIKASDEAADGALGYVTAARDALRGGEDGARELAVWADDGYAHPDAHHFLKAIAAPDDMVDRVPTSFAFDPDATDGTVLDRVATGDRESTVIDRNGHGAILRDPPTRTCGSGDEAPFVGLDATARELLWSETLGESVTTADIHETDRERREFLRDALGLQLVRCADRPRPYEGSPSGKDLDGDVALLEAISEGYAGLQAPRQRGEAATVVGDPAVVTTKGVREVLEHDDRTDDVTSAWENYGNLTGANDLGGHRLAALLGSQHYGDHAVERMAALAGEEADTSRETGRGGALDYGSPVANTYLAHMREDQVMQAALRFARGESGATVFARTSALRDDLPVVGRGQVVETYSETAAKIATAWRRVEAPFTRADVADAVDVSDRQVRRVLAEFVEAGYLRRVGGGEGVASEFAPGREAPGAGEVSLPGDALPDAPGQSASNEYYTWNVRVSDVRTGVTTSTPVGAGAEAAPPAPGGAIGAVGPPD